LEILFSNILDNQYPCISEHKRKTMTYDIGNQVPGLYVISIN